jgi:hypothetical protein
MSINDQTAVHEISEHEATFTKILARQRRSHGRARSKNWANSSLPDSQPYILVGSPVNNIVALKKATWGCNREMTYKNGDPFLWYESAERAENGDHKGGGRGIFAVGEFTSDVFESRAKLWPDGLYPYRVGIRIVRLLESTVDMAALKETLAPDAGVNWRFVRRDRQLSDEEWTALKPILARMVNSSKN